MLFFIIIGILSVILLLNVKYRNMRNPYKLHVVFGKKGSGKSTYFAKLAKKALKQHKKVYTNMVEMNIPNVIIFDPLDLGDKVPEPNSVCLIDEGGIVFDNRNYKTFKASARDFFKLQRHYKCEVWLASQSFDIDKKLRDLTDDMMLAVSIFPWLSVFRPIKRTVTLVEASALGESRIADNLKFKWIFSWKFLFLPKYVKLFDSFKVEQKPYI